MIPICIGCILVIPFAIQKLELLLLEIIHLAFVVRHDLITVMEHVHLQVVHLDLQIKVLDRLLVANHFDTSILEISRCLDLQVEALLDTRMLPGPLTVFHRFVLIGCCIPERL